MPPTANLDQATGGFTNRQQEIKRENGRALAEFVMTMPSGTLTRLVSKEKSEEFPEGCAHSALEALRKRVGKVSASNEGLLKESFESGEKLGKKINPAKYLIKLITIRDTLQDKYQYNKTDQDILDQMMKVLNDNYSWTKNELKKARRMNMILDLDEVQMELEERYQEIKNEKKKGKKMILSEDSLEEMDEQAFTCMPTNQPYMRKVDKGMNRMYRDPNNPHIAYIKMENGEGFERNQGFLDVKKGKGNGIGQLIPQQPTQFINKNQPNMLTNQSYNNNRQNFSYDKQFKGICYNCGAWGHKGATCPEKKKPCIHCGKDTHRDEQCWELEVNA